MLLAEVPLPLEPAYARVKDLKGFNLRFAGTVDPQMGKDAEREMLAADEREMKKKKRNRKTRQRQKAKRSKIKKDKKAKKRRERNQYELEEKKGEQLGSITAGSFTYGQPSSVYILCDYRVASLRSFPVMRYSARCEPPERLDFRPEVEPI